MTSIRCFYRDTEGNANYTKIEWKKTCCIYIVINLDFPRMKCVYSLCILKCEIMSMEVI